MVIHIMYNAFIQYTVCVYYETPKETFKMKKKITILPIALILLIAVVMFSSCDFTDTLFTKTVSVTVTLDPNGGNVSILTIKGNSGDSMELPTPQRE